MRGWLAAEEGGCVVTVKVTPRASKPGFVGLEGEWARVRLQAPPVDGKANAELVAFLAKTFGVTKRDVELVSGETGRLKRVRLSGVAAEAVLRKWT